MARLIPAEQRIQNARALLQKARLLPVPEGLGRRDLSYVAQVKDLTRQARDLVKFIPYSVTATVALKAAVAEINQQAEAVEQELLRGKG